MLADVRWDRWVWGEVGTGDHRHCASASQPQIHFYDGSLNGWFDVAVWLPKTQRTNETIVQLCTHHTKARLGNSYSLTSVTEVHQGNYV